MTVLVIHAQSVEKRRSNTTRTSYNGTSTLTRFVGRSAGEETPHHDVAFVGLIANVVGTVLLKRGSNENMNIRAA